MQTQVYIKVKGKKEYNEQIGLAWSSSAQKSDRQGIVELPSEESETGHSCCIWAKHSAFKRVLFWIQSVQLVCKMKKHMEHKTAAAAGKQGGSYLKDTQEASKANLVNNCCIFII